MNPTKGNHQLDSQEKLIMQRVKLKLISKNEEVEVSDNEEFEISFSHYFFQVLSVAEKRTRLFSN